MAKKSLIERDLKRRRMANKFAARRSKLKATARDRSLPIQERIEAQLKLSELPRNSAPTRQRNRCQLTGRPRGVYRKLMLSRIALRELGSQGMIPGFRKSSW